VALQGVEDNDRRSIIRRSGGEKEMKWVDFQFFYVHPNANWYLPLVEFHLHPNNRFGINPISMHRLIWY
jgi:hypothetical protein